MLFADLTVVTTRVERLEASLKKPRPDRESSAKELAIVKAVHAVLEEGKTVASLDLSAEDKKPLRSFGLLTDKPEVVLLNTIQGQPIPQSLLALAPESLAVDAKLELELSQLDQEERAAFMLDMEISELAKDRIIRRAYDAVGIITFFTAGEPEVRGWNLERGASAVEAAGKIHTDLAKGFIRAEVTAYDDLLQRRVRQGSQGQASATPGRQGLRRQGRRRRLLPQCRLSRRNRRSGFQPDAHSKFRLRLPIRSHRMLGVRSSIPVDSGEFRCGNVSRLARQSKSACWGVPINPRRDILDRLGFQRSRERRSPVASRHRRSLGARRDRLRRPSRRSSRRLPDGLTWPIRAVCHGRHTAPGLHVDRCFTCGGRRRTCAIDAVVSRAAFST